MAEVIQRVWKSGPRTRVVERPVAALPGRELVIDGEVAVFDAQLLSRFEYLTVAPPPEVVITPPVYVAFDVLQVPRPRSPARPLTDRRSALGGPGGFAQEPASAP
jgi:ATP-dependent DNA ligase